jgi:hypothetical protein
VIGVLASYYGDRKIASKLASVEVGPIVWDSGAYSVFTGATTIAVEDHTAWVKTATAATTTSERMRYIGLDVIGSASGTLDNHRVQIEAGARVEPTIHFGAPLEAIDQLLAVNPEPEWVNVGGLVGRLQPSNRRRVASFIRAVRKRIPETTKLHALGCCTPGVLELVGIDASDSSVWLNPSKFGVVNLFDPTKHRWRRLMHTGSQRWSKAEHNTVTGARHWLRRYYGVSIQDLLSADQKLLDSLAVRALALIAQWSSELHGRPVTVYLAGATPQLSNLAPIIQSANKEYK